MGKKIIWIIVITVILLNTGCDEIINQPLNQNEADKHALAEILNHSKTIEEIYYEEKPQSTVHPGGVKIQSVPKVWFKNDILKTELAISFYKDESLLYTETVGELYDYNSLDQIRYYLGPYPEQANLHFSAFKDNMSLPRDQTVLWYLDWITVDLYTVEEGIHEGKECLIVEILKNSSGSTQVWISKTDGLPIKIINNYNGNTSVREYHSFRVGKDAVPDSALSIPADALIF